MKSEYDSGFTDGFKAGTVSLAMHARRAQRFEAEVHTLRVQVHELKRSLLNLLSPSNSPVHLHGDNPPEVSDCDDANEGDEFRHDVLVPQ